METNHSGIETNAQDADALRQKDYDDAIAVYEEIERQIADLGSTVTPIGYQLILVNMLIACFYPAVWIVVVLFYVTAIVASVRRNAAKDALKRRDIEAAKSAIAEAKGWSMGLILTQVAMAAVELWGFFQLLTVFKRH